MLRGHVLLEQQQSAVEGGGIEPKKYVSVLHDDPTLEELRDEANYEQFKAHGGVGEVRRMKKKLLICPGAPH